MHDGPSYDRRIGARAGIDRRVELCWGEPRRSGLLGRRRTQDIGLIRDVSVSGAAIEAPERSDVGIGSAVPVRVGDWVGVVIVARMEPVAGDRVLHGVQFGDLDPQLRELFHSLVGSERPDEELQRYWNRAD